MKLWQWAVIGSVAVVAVVMAPADTDNNLVQPAKQRAQTGVNPVKTKVAGTVELERLTRKAQEGETAGDPFDKFTWYVAPPPPAYVPPPPPPPPPPPTAPPLPFTYLGSYDDSVTKVIILAKGDQIYTVVVGDVIENTYRVEKISVGLLTLTYLPLKIEQTLRTGETS